jgi:4-hydroxybenzoate polyprenyltransferase
LKLPVKTFDIFVFGNLFIALCAGSMVQSTYLLNGIENPFSPLTFFIAVSTYLLYNFHHIAFQLNYESVKLIFALFLCSFIQVKTLLFLILMSIPALLYSIPIFTKGDRKMRLREMLFFKMPLLAFVWAFSTVIIPAVDSGIPITSVFLWFQFISRLCFIFALCIPFELRDVEFDSANQVRTIPVVYGARFTRVLGISVIAAEIIIHHTANWYRLISFNILTALDVSSLIALVWILFDARLKSKYFYKLMVDGTMIIRYLLLLLFYS